MANPLQQLEAVLKENVLDLYKTARDLIEQSDEVMSTFNSVSLCPIHKRQAASRLDLIVRLKREYQIPAEVINTQLSSLPRREEEALTGLYLAIGFALRLRLSGASEEKIKSLVNTYSFGLSEPEERRIMSTSGDGAGTS
jgi:hypothetical protein